MFSTTSTTSHNEKQQVQDRGPCKNSAGCFHFGSHVEGQAWSLLELQTAEHGMPAGAYIFSAQTIWRSVDNARTWAKYKTAVGGTVMPTPIADYPYGQDTDAGFFMQSEVYRRRDGRFLHGCRVPTHSNHCDNWDGSQLWHSTGE